MGNFPVQLLFPGAVVGKSFQQSVILFAQCLPYLAVLMSQGICQIKNLFLDAFDEFLIPVLYGLPEEAVKIQRPMSLIMVPGGVVNVSYFFQSKLILQEMAYFLCQGLRKGFFFLILFKGKHHRRQNGSPVDGRKQGRKALSCHLPKPFFMEGGKSSFQTVGQNAAEFLPMLLQPALYHC